MVSRHNPRQPVLPPFREWFLDAAAEPKATRAARPKYFTSGAGQNPAAAAALVRGILENALETSFTVGGLGAVLWRDSPDLQAATHGLAVYREIQLALFPEDFADPDVPDLVPAGGLKRAGVDRMLLFAECVLRRQEVSGKV